MLTIERQEHLFISIAIQQQPPFRKKISMTEKGLLHTHVIIKSVLNKAILFS